MAAKIYTIKVVELLPDKRCKALCGCGNYFVARRDNIRNGHTRSCGCFFEEGRKVNGSANKTHGHTIGSRGVRRNSPTYVSWASMKQRCNPNTTSAQCIQDYVERGISVCERWRAFANFLADMGERPPGTSLERKNNELGYFPENCVWATRKEQNSNRRSPVAGESTFEKNCVKLAELHGWYSLKIARSNRRGYPDRLFIKHGLHVWIEFKDEDCDATLQQQIRHKELRDAGALVYTISAPNDAAFRRALAIPDAR